MVIDGVSQSTGVERLLEVAPAEGGVVLLVIRDRIGNVERERIALPPDELLTTLTDRPVGQLTIDGVSPDGGKRLLDIEVRRNEVLLVVRDPAAAGWDAAIGLDDFMDALAGALPSG